MNYSLLTSRTFWTFIAMLAFGAGNQVLPLIPATYAGLFEVVLMALGSYFHLSAVHTAAGVQAAPNVE